MNKEKYLADRKALTDAAQALINEGKFEDAEAKTKEIEALDLQFENSCKAQANLNAMQGKAKFTNISDLSENAGGNTVVATLGEGKAVDEKNAYLNAWAKNMQGAKLDTNDQAVFDKVNSTFSNAFTHDTNNTAVLIPETVVAGIWKRAEEMYPLLADVKKFGVSGTLTMKKHTGITAGDAAWYDETTATADEQNAFGELTLTGCELSKSITITWKLRAMATEEFIPFIINELGERVGVALGTSVSQGKGKPGEGDTFKAEPQGIETALLAESSTPQVVTYDFDNATPVPLTYEKFTAAIGKIHSSYLSGAAIYASNTTIWNKLANLLDGQGRPLFIPDIISSGVGRMFGMVVKADAGMKANDILIGNANAGYIMNTNEPMSVATEEHVKARTVDYAAYTIVDGAVLDTKAFALIHEVVVG